METKTKKRNVISRNHYEYQVVMSEKFMNELQSSGVGDELYITDVIGTVSSAIKFNIGDKILIRISSFDYISEGEDKKKYMKEDREKLEKIYNFIDGALPCNVVDIYFNLSFQDSSYYYENYGEMTPFVNAFPDASWIIVIEPI